MCLYLGKMFFPVTVFKKDWNTKKSCILVSPLASALKTCYFQSRWICARESSPEKSCTSRCETELWTSCRSWLQAPSPDCISAGYVGFPPPAGMMRTEHLHQPSHTLWRRRRTKRRGERRGEERREEKRRERIKFSFTHLCWELNTVFSYMLSSFNMSARIFDIQVMVLYVDSSSPPLN